ncbi:hypothetical protein GYMLUDRAFT_250068 [Collybiopsis luxurians FD-317 M1]|uniref:Uncharacterized protein n=1 Tax=Collybiopsis luxurians FD-317 M1 TaxID=944289 RepID=A0A0D0CFK4_9AGAR|nr:hypothetical protein GYMLUDRAFT_250068 [Collybiopsis luxurians FD-317 M1]
MSIALQHVQVAIPGCAALLSLAILCAQLSSDRLVRKWRLANSDNAEPVLTATTTSKARLHTSTVYMKSSTSGELNSTHILLFTYTYAIIIAIISLTITSSCWRAALTRHSSIVLLVTWLVYGYRNVFPLATFSETPPDLCKGWILWTEVAILTVTAIVIPAAMPQEYIPVDPKHPMPIPNPEHTASIFSLGFFFFLDPVVFEAYRVSHLPYDRLSPLADDDSIQNLKAVYFRHLDPFSGD